MLSPEGILEVNDSLWPIHVPDEVTEHKRPPAVESGWGWEWGLPGCLYVQKNPYLDLKD